VEPRTRIDLPAVVHRPFEVYLNGVRQTEGPDFELIGVTLVFSRLLTPEPRLSYWRWFLLFLGVWSSFRKYDTIAIVYTAEQRRLVETIPASGFRTA
jgi:hypothetical protein